MFELKVVYTESGTKYTLPFDILKKYVDKETIQKIQIQVKKEIAKL